MAPEARDDRYAKAGVISGWELTDVSLGIKPGSSARPVHTHLSSCVHPCSSKWNSILVQELCNSSRQLGDSHMSVVALDGLSAEMPRRLPIWK